MSHTSLEEALAYRFKDSAWLQLATTHRSFSSDHNERLEFLGDAVLGCVMASMLVERYPDLDEGDLSRLRSNLVKQQSLYEIAQTLPIGEALRLGDGELKSGGAKRPSILSDCLEALIGAIYTDGGFEAASQLIRRLYKPVFERVNPHTLGKDAKTLLQEFLQGIKLPLPSYEVVATHGAAHSQEFEVQCSIPKLNIQVLGSGASRRAAEQNAARAALAQAESIASQIKPKSGRKAAKMGPPKASKPAPVPPLVNGTSATASIKIVPPLEGQVVGLRSAA